MKKYKLITLIAITIMCFSCSDESTGIIEENNEQNISSFEDYFRFLNEETDGNVLMQSIKTNNSNGKTFSVSSSIKGNKSPLTLKINDRTLNFPEYTYDNASNKSFSNLSNQELSSVFGNTFKVELSNDEVFARLSSEIQSAESVYVPTLVDAEFSNMVNGKITAGAIITWNFDQDNSNGIVVGLEYNPYAQLKQEIVDEKSDRLLIGVTVADTGSYTLTASDLLEFPSNSMLTFYIARAGYGITTDDSGENDYSLAGLTVFRADLEIQK